MTERNINSSIKTALVSNDDFVYAHLIKFERPFDSLDSAYRTNTNRYAYYTDGATDIVYGGNTYRANRILSIGTYSETTQARATSMKLTLAAENISAKIALNGAITVSGSEGTFTPSSTTHNGEILDFVEEGFREGDQIKVTYSSTTKTFVINSFTTNNTVIKFSRTGTDTDDSTLAAVSSTSFTIELDSEELKGITRDRVTSVAGVIASSPDFVNREVTIDKIFIEPETGAIIGNATVTVFKGIIASVDINETLTGSKVNWTLTSHWGDFASIQGRMTTDETHRALDARGAPQPESAHRREYAADLGFLHSETSLSAIANYQTQETRFRMKSKKRGGIAGLTGQKKYWQEEYQTDVQHEVDLNVHLQGKHLPIVYGVQRINGNPIFADTLNNNSKVIYTADAICEGEVHGLFNIYIDDVPLICTDDNDFDVRNVTSGTDKDNTQLQCYGNMSHGSTLSGERYDGNASTDPQINLTAADLAELNMTSANLEDVVIVGVLPGDLNIQGGISPALGTTSAAGLGHDENWNITHPYSISSHFLAGRPNQRAAGMLLEPAIANSKVLGVRVINKGSGYGSTAPSVSFSGGGGSGAQATAVLGSDDTDDAGQVRYIRIDSQGSGYTSAPTVTVSGSATAVADLGGYKRQNHYYDGNLPYWSVNHRLLDTAYSAFKFEIDADSTNIPEIEYVMKGKVMECFNYDHTYIPDAALGGSDNPINFAAGDLVTVQYSTDGSNWTTDTTGNFTSGKFKIMDSYLFTSNRDVAFQKFRLDKAPSLLFTDGTPARTRLRLKNDSNQYWHMITWNHAVVKESDNISFPDHTVAATAGVNGSGELQFSSIDNAEKTKLGDNSGKTFVQFYDPNWYDDSSTINDGVKGLKYGLLEGTWSTSGSDNILTFPNTKYTGVTFNQSIKLLNAYDLDFTGISAIENATQNELQQTHVVNNSFGFSSTFAQKGAVLTNLSTGESREIEAFSTGSDIITLDTPFFTPCLSSHKFKIDGKGSDRRASINPAMQTLDYLTTSRYGKGLKLNEIDLSSFLESALLCDTRSDIEMKVTSTSGVTVGDIYQLVDPNNSNAHVASGKVLSVGTNSVGNPIVTFTDVINKFAKEYATRTSLSAGDIVFTEAGNFYRATGTITNPPATVPTHTSGTVLSLEAISSLNINKLSGSGPSTIAMSLNKGHPLEYSLYDSDFVKYWRYVGWERNHQAEVTRHQTNFVLDTSKSVFANTNALLSHFNGILSYENGKYVLSVETEETAPAISLNSSQENVNAFYIEEKDIIGSLKVVDNSQKSGKNTIKASISDPQNNYGTRAVTFFNSNFLEADRGVVKTGTFPYTGITNYYNARIGTEKELVHTRFSKEVSFDVGPRGLLLRAGQVIALSYEAFGWSSKLFRIENLNFKANCSVSVKCREYDDSIYSITKQRKLKIVSEAAPDFDGKAPGAPLSLTATNNKNGSIVLAWANAEDFIEGSDSTEIFYHTSQDRTAAILLATVDNATGYTHTSAAAETLYFWVRHRRVVSAVTGNRKDVVRGNYFPASATGGVQGISLSISAGATSIKLLPSSHVIDYNVVGNENTSVTFTTDTQGMEGSIFYEFIVGATTKQNTTTSTFTLADSDEPGPTDAPIKVLVKARQGANNGTVLAQDQVSIFSVQDGQSTVTGILTNEAHTVATSNDGTGGSFAGAGGTFKVFYGNTDITSNAKTVFSVSSETGVDVSINSSTGVYTVSSMSADTGTAVFSCEVEGSLVGGIDNQNDVTITKTYTISRAKAGTTGAAGQANAIVYAYQRSASALTSNPGAVTVSLEGTTSGTITTGSLANGWSKTIPVGTNPLYVCAATAAGTGSTDTIAANEWSSPVVLAQGETGVNSATVFLYQNNNTGNAPSNLPSGNATYTFATSSLGSFATNANGWSTTNPGVTDSNRYLWVTTATAAANTATDIIADSEWATIKLLAQKGDDGAAGAAGLTGLLTNENASATYYGGIGLNVYSIVNYSSTGGEFKVFEGASEKTSGVVYTITGGSSSGGSTTKTQNGLTLTINQSTGVYIASGNSWTTEKEEFTLTGTIGSTVITKVYNIDRKLAFTTTELTASAQTFSYDKDSANPSPSTITLTASVPFNFSFFTSYTYQYQFSKSTDNGANFSVVQSWSTTRTLSVSAGAFSLGNEVFKVEVRSTFLNTTVLDSDQQTLIRIKEGDTGQQGIQGVEGDDGASNFTIFQESASQPSTPSAGTSNPPTSSWYSTVTAARNAVSGNGLVWFSVGTKPGTSTTITWSEPIRYIELYDQIGGTKPPEDANKFLTIADAVEGRMRFSINGGTTTDYDIFTSGERTKLDRLRLGKAPDSDTILISNASIAEADIVGSGKTFGAGQKPNKTTFADGTTEGVFNFQLDGATAVGVNVFSSAERTKLDRLRLGRIPTSDTVLLENTTDSQTKVDNRLSSTEKTRLNAGSSPDNTKSFDNAGTITGNLTGTVGGVANATIRSGAAAGATANQDSTSTILAGDLTGSVNGTAVATIKSGAAAGATANQDSTSTILGGTHTGDVSGTIGGVANATIRGGVSRANSAIDSSNRLIADFHDGTTTFSRAELFRVRDGFDNIGSGTLTLKTANLPTVPVNKGGTGVSDSTLFLNSELDTADITGAGGVDASSLAYGEIASSSGSTATSWSHNGVAYTPTATTQTITLTIAHPTFGTSTVVGTWTRTNFQITNFSLGTGSGMSGSGNNNWTFGDVDSDSGSADNAFGSSTANYGTKTLYVQHSSSNKRVEITAFVLNLNFGGGGKCLTPAMLPENLQIGDEIDSPEGKTKVIDIQYKEREGYYILEDELEITNDHPILIDGEWILAEEYAGKKEYIDKPTEVVYVETENELLTVKDWTVGGKY